MKLSWGTKRTLLCDFLANMANIIYKYININIYLILRVVKVKLMYVLHDEYGILNEQMGSKIVLLYPCLSHPSLLWFGGESVCRMEVDIIKSEARENYAVWPRVHTIKSIYISNYVKWSVWLVEKMKIQNDWEQIRNGKNFWKSLC